MPIKNLGVCPRGRHRLIPITRPMALTVIRMRRKLSQLQNDLIVSQADPSCFVTLDLVRCGFGGCSGLVRNRLDRIADGLLLVIVIPPAFQEGQILTATVVCRIQKHLQPVFDLLGVELAQQFGAALIHPL